MYEEKERIDDDDEAAEMYNTDAEDEVLKAEADVAVEGGAMDLRESNLSALNNNMGCFVVDTSVINIINISLWARALPEISGKV